MCTKSCVKTTAELLRDTEQEVIIIVTHADCASYGRSVSPTATKVWNTTKARRSGGVWSVHYDYNYGKDGQVCQTKVAYTRGTN